MHCYCVSGPRIWIPLNGKLELQGWQCYCTRRPVWNLPSIIAVGWAQSNSGPTFNYTSLVWTYLLVAYRMIRCILIFLHFHFTDIGLHVTLTYGTRRKGWSLFPIQWFKESFSQLILSWKGLPHVSHEEDHTFCYQAIQSRVNIKHLNFRVKLIDQFWVHPGYIYGIDCQQQCLNTFRY